MANIELTTNTKGTGWFTVKDNAATFTTDPKKLEGATVLATVDGSAVTVANSAENGVSDTVGHFEIHLGTAGRAASVSNGSTVYGTTGNDSVSISGTDVKLYLGNGADSVVSADKGAKNAFVDAGAGDDSISIGGAKVTVSAGAGADNISIVGDSAEVYGEAGNDVLYVAGKSSYVNAGAGNDTVSLGGDSVLAYGGTGNDSILAEGDNAQIYGEDGNDTISVAGANAQIYGGTGNDSILAAGANAYIEAGEGADIVSIGASGATIDAGAGNDSIVVAAGTATTITLGDGKDTVSVGATGVSLQDYTYGTDTIVLGDGKGSAASVTSEVTLSTDGVIAAEQGVAVQITPTSDGYYKAKLSSTDGASQGYAWVSTESSTIDLSSETSAFFVNASLNDETSDTILGGVKADTIVAASNDYVNGGRGDDSISVVANSTGVTVALSSNGGNDSIASDTTDALKNMLGFNDDNLTLYVDDATSLGFNYGGNTSSLMATLKGASAQFNTVTVTPDKALDLRVNAAGTVKNYEIVSGKAVIDDQTDVFYGVSANSSVSVGATGAPTVIDLSNHGHFGDTHTYVNTTFIDATASDGEGDILIGANDASSTIKAGTGSSSLFGVGKEGDSLVGGNGADAFFYGEGYGNDTVSGYNGDKDQIVFLKATTGFSKSDKALTLALGSESLTVENAADDAANTVYTLSTYGDPTFTMKIGVETTANTFTYDADDTTKNAGWYYGGNKTDTVKITGSNNVEMWLGETWKGFTTTNVENIDASEATGELLLWGVADTASTITAGKNTSSIFGGFGATGNDVLVGGSAGTTTYEFGLGCGKDTIKSSKSTDSIYLYNAVSTDVTSITTAGRGLVLTLSDESTLTIDQFGSGTVSKITFSDGTTQTIDTKNKKLVAAE